MQKFSYNGYRPGQCIIKSVTFALCYKGFKPNPFISFNPAYNLLSAFWAFAFPLSDKLQWG